MGYPNSTIAERLDSSDGLDDDDLGDKPDSIDTLDGDFDDELDDDFDGSDAGKVVSSYQRTKYCKLLRLPNVHAGLHLAENAREYGYNHEGRRQK